MMESCLNNDVDRRVQIEVDDLKRDLSSEFSTLPDPQEKEHLQVYLRIRPFSAAETNNGESQGCVTIEHPDTILLKPPSLSLSARLSADKSLPQTGQRFQFSQVYGPETMQRELFQGTVKDLVKDVLEGGNSLVFTYGVTNAGKTFTFLGPDADAGILPRSLNVIFSSIEEQVFTGMSIKPQRCREFTKLTREQQAEEVTFKRNFLSQFKQVTRSSMLDTTVAAEDKISLAVEAHTKFSVWVSFCEIYNENIHDLLEVIPSGAPRRTALRLSQDVKGNSFVRDLRWIQVNGAEEAYKVMKLGKKNQSFSSTRLNQLSSRSHSIFSIRILRIEDIGTPKVHAVSELCLCDLAGSERCAKTQNKGERLKEAGNINTSLLILGKCINGLRHNQQAKLLQHVPFRESKLTHYLQGFFRGRGKACMIVNINQCASMYDETLNVLKFSAVAQKVVVLSTRPPPIIIIPKRSAGDISFIINNAERKSLQSSRRTSLIGWDTSLEDVQEDEDDEYEEEMSQMEGTMDQTGNDEDTNTSDDSLLIGEQTHQLQLKKERAESLLMEARLREEISREFSEIFSEMQIDYNNRLARESEILEERAERRLEIFKNLMNKMATPESSQDAQSMVTQSPLLGAHFMYRVVCLLIVWVNVTNMNSKTKGADRVLVQLQTAQAQLDQHAEEIPEKTSLIHTLTQEVQSLKRELQTAATSSDAVDHQLREEVSELRESLAEEKEKNESKDTQMLELEHQLGQTKEQLAHKWQISNQQLQQFTEERNQLEAASTRQVEELRKKLREREETSQQTLDELGFKLKCQEHANEEEVKQLRAKLEEPARASEKLAEELNEKLREREVMSQQQLEELKCKLGEQKATFGKLLDDLGLKLSEQEQSAAQLKVELEESKLKGSNNSSSSAAEEELKKLNSDLQTEIASLRSKVFNMEESTTGAQLASSEFERMRKENVNRMEELAEAAKASTELQKELLAKEAQVTSLQKSLQEAQEQREEQESHAVQEARRREVERRRELLAVAHEAIAQKDAALEKRGSAGCQSVLDSSEISTENGRTRRFPRPELEIAFSSLQPNRMALRRQGEENAVTVKITRSARKRKSGEMEKVRSNLTKDWSRNGVQGGKMKSPQKDDSRSRKEGTLQKIGDFLQSSPTLLGTKAKKMMSLVSRRGDDSSASSSSLSLRATKNKKKLFRPEISSPMDMPSHPVIATHTHTHTHKVIVCYFDITYCQATYQGVVVFMIIKSCYLQIIPKKYQRYISILVMQKGPFQIEYSR
uniref:Kinesin family member 20Ba n=1 Tax=Cyclopterus lumpus TaxID=8103 RepID=A0A8C3AS47_CYCLU